jgi:hypothetical protein
MEMTVRQMRAKNAIPEERSRKVGARVQHDVIDDPPSTRLYDITEIQTQEVCWILLLEQMPRREMLEIQLILVRSEEIFRSWGQKLSEVHTKEADQLTRKEPLTSAVCHRFLTSKWLAAKYDLCKNALNSCAAEQQSPSSSSPQYRTWDPVREGSRSVLSASGNPLRRCPRVLSFPIDDSLDIVSDYRSARPRNNLTGLALKFGENVIKRRSVLRFWQPAALE